MNDKLDKIINDNWKKYQLREFFDGAESGDSQVVEIGVKFLEDDPMFFRSGYHKATVIQKLKKFELSKDIRKRLQKVILNRVDNRDQREFRKYCQLAVLVSDDDFVSTLKIKLKDENSNIQRRAKWVVDALEKKS